MRDRRIKIENPQAFNPAESNTREDSSREQYYVDVAHRLEQEDLRKNARYFFDYFGRGEMDGLEGLL